VQFKFDIDVEQLAALEKVLASRALNEIDQYIQPAGRVKCNGINSRSLAMFGPVRQG
jgi:hypothetical protein